ADRTDPIRSLRRAADHALRQAHHLASLAPQQGPGPRTSDLSDPEVLVLWAIRRWAVARLNDEPIQPTLGRPFAYGQASRGASLLDEFLVRAVAGARRPLQFRHPYCQSITRDEELVLGALRMLQTRRYGAAHRNLDDALCASAVSLVCDAGVRFVDEL